MTIRLKIITSRLFLPTLSGEREVARGSRCKRAEIERGESARAARRDVDRFAREIFYGLLAPGAEKGNVVAVI